MDIEAEQRRWPLSQEITARNKKITLAPMFLVHLLNLIDKPLWQDEYMDPLKFFIKDALSKRPFHDKKGFRCTKPMA